MLHLLSSSRLFLFSRRFLSNRHRLGILRIAPKQKKKTMMTTIECKTKNPRQLNRTLNSSVLCGLMITEVVLYSMGMKRNIRMNSEISFNEIHRNFSFLSLSLFILNLTSSLIYYQISTLSSDHQLSSGAVYPFVFVLSVVIKEDVLFKL